MNCLKQLIFSFFFFLACDKVTDVGIVIDSSSSVRRDGYENVKAFLVKLVDKIHVSPRMSHVAVIHYNHRAYLDWDFNAPQAKNSVLLKAAILKLRYRPGGTRTDRALEKASKEMFNDAHGQRPNVPHVLFVITDGKTSSRSKPYPEVQKPLKVNIRKFSAVFWGLNEWVVALTVNFFNSDGWRFNFGPFNV